eukprot:2184961-Pleurochrysis_carterae.AAC.3
MTGSASNQRWQRDITQLRAHVRASAISAEHGREFPVARDFRAQFNVEAEPGLVAALAKARAMNSGSTEMSWRPQAKG